MKSAYIIFGVLFVIGAFFFVKDEFVNLEILNKGRTVEMKIIELPGSCLGTRAKWFMKVRYQDKIISKQIPGGFCEEHNIGDIIRVKYLEGTDRILLSDENITTEFLSSGVLALFGLYAIYAGMKRGKKAKA